MGISKKGLRTINRNGRDFFWCVKKDEDDCDCLHLTIKTDDRAFNVDYRLSHQAENTPFISVKGPEFKGLIGLGGCWQRFRTPLWKDDIVTPALVAEIIDWCLTNEEVTSVDYEGNAIG